MASDTFLIVAGAVVVYFLVRAWKLRADKSRRSDMYERLGWGLLIAGGIGDRLAGSNTRGILFLALLGIPGLVFLELGWRNKGTNVDGN